MSSAPPRNPHTSPTTTLALDWLDADQHGANVLATARNLLAAEKETRHVLPPAIAAACKVARIERQRITLAVPSAAYASKLRQLGPRVLQRLNGAGWNLSEITVRVQGGLQQSGTIPSSRQTEPLGPAALRAFDQLHAGLRPGPLSDAVSRLLSRHGDET